MSQNPQSPQSPETKRMVQDPQRSKMVSPKQVWIKAVRALTLKSGQTLREGDVAQVGAKEAREFCDRRFQNSYPYAGERMTSSPDSALGVIVRAVRVSEQEAKVALETMAKPVDPLDDEESEASA